MLTHLQLRDFVIVDQAELEFGAGMTALTGETGAGKSIVVDALLLIGGGRSGSDVVRQGAERAEVTASFAALPKAARAWFEAQSMECDEETVVRRVISADGRSRAYVNGQVVPLQSLRELADFLIDIHGQQEFQHLVTRGAQRDLLDARLADAALLTDVARIHADYRDARHEFETLQAAVTDRDARLDLLRYQLAELKAEVSSSAEIESLFADQKRIASRGRLAQAAQSALLGIYDADAGSAQDLIGQAQSALRAAAETDPALKGATLLLNEASIAVQEAAAQLRTYLEDLDVDPARQEEIERRAAALEALARKHRVPPIELPTVLTRIEGELGALEAAHSSLSAIQARLALLTTQFQTHAAALSKARQRAASVLGTEVSALMQTLGMAGGKFAVNVQGGCDMGPHGSDEIEFQVSANPGQPLKPLAKVASGGELSRISLAVQVAAAGNASANCMVFDEVDSGIGGAVAEIVGRQLRALGSHAQVLCVTHLPQVASQAHGQFRVTKLTDGKVTRTQVKQLNAAERIEEIARMLGGVDITPQARAHAEEMLSLAEAPKKKRARGAAR